MSTIFLTGANGVLGNAVRRHFSGLNFNVYCYDKSYPEPHSQASGESNIKWIAGDVLDLQHLAKSISDSGCEYVVHLAALVASYANSNPREAIEVNVGGTANVLEAAKLAGCRGVVYISSRSVYGNVGKSYSHPEYRLVSESYRCRPESFYSMTKRAAEMVIERYSALRAIPSVILRFGAIYGPGKTDAHGSTRIFSEAIEAASIGQSLRIGGAEQLEDFVYSEDIPEAIYCAVRLLSEKKRIKSAQVFNIGSGIGVSINKFAELIAGETGVTLTVESGLGVMNRDFRQSFVMNCHRANEYLGYKPKYDLVSGIKHYVSTVARAAA